MTKRTQQIGDELRRVISEAIQYELKDPRVGFATVIGVEVSGDLQHAQVQISVMGDDAQRRETMQALERAKGFLRRQVAQELRHLRYVPELHLKLDTSLDYTLRIDEVLRQVQDERAANQPPPAPPPDDDGPWAKDE